MNFTREPIIETVITPREGCKLLVRSSKASSQEEYAVDAVEVVSFGHSFFYRCLERPRSFLVPVSDYEILEQKETRLPLKNAPLERSIKIGGGRPPREAPEEESSPDSSEPTSPERRGRDRRGRRGRRGGRGGEAPRSAPLSEESASPEESAPLPALDADVGAPSDVSPAAEAPKAPSFISKLFPPPLTLIKDTIGRYKQADEEAAPDRPRQAPHDSDEGTDDVDGNR